MGLRRTAQIARTSQVGSRKQPKQGWWPQRRTIWSCQAARGPLLTRYYLIETRWFAIYLHHLHASDEDRALHDHPWAFWTFLFSRGYYEWTPTGRYWRRRFSLLRRPALWAHRLELLRPTWTLILRGPYVREWGFHTATGWQPWAAYGEEYCD